MRAWSGNIRDCLIAPNRALYYTDTEHIGTVMADGPEARLGFHTDFYNKYGPLDFVSIAETRSQPKIDAVGFAGTQHWTGFSADLQRITGHGGRRFPIGGDAWLACELGGIVVQIDGTRDKFPLYFRRTELDSGDTSVVPFVFDDEWLLVMVPAPGSPHQHELLLADRKDLRKVVIHKPYGVEVPHFHFHSWTREWLLVHPAVVDPPVIGVRANGESVTFRPPKGHRVFTFTAAGVPVHWERDGRGVFVGDRHYDFDLGGPTRGAAVSPDGLTLAYWTGRAVVQFDLE